MDTYLQNADITFILYYYTLYDVVLLYFLTRIKRTCIKIKW